MSAITHTIVVCIEYLRGLAEQARTVGLKQEAAVLEKAADGMWQERARLRKETKAAFGAEDDAR